MAAKSKGLLSRGRFTSATRDWFDSAFGAPTPVQEAAWTAIGGGHHTLVIAPTGSGKTLAAFMHAIDRLFREQAELIASSSATEKRRATKTRVLYISPIKALGADIQRNLALPLQGIMAERKQRGDVNVTLTVGMRTGDTPATVRASLVRRPPDILITTPESLFLMLTSRASEALRDVSTIIIDEIHAVAGTKRGSHLALSLERLDALLAEPAQRIGLSATVRPVDRVAEFLGGDRPVTLAAPPSSRHLDIRIVVPVEDMSNVPERDLGEVSRKGRPGSIWPHVEDSILDQVLTRRSTIVFVNSRGVAERLTARLNEAYASRLAGEEALSATEGHPPIQYESSAGSSQARSSGVAATIARSHHGSVSKEHRAEIEEALKSGELRCVVATSSLELGIDMGLVDLVIQVSAPPSVASALQRVGRAGHQVGGISTGLVYPRTRRDVINSAVIADAVLAGRIEAIDPPRNALDVLAQQTVAAVAMEPLDVDAWYATVRRASPYRTLPRKAFDATLDMLSGRYPSDDFAGFKPRLVWDREAGRLSARPGAQRLAVTSGGTIPDRGMFSVVLPEGEERAGSRRVGELDEEMVYESRVNDVITLGATSWRIQEITRDQVVVTPAPGRSARLPFWRGDGIGRPAELGEAIGAFLGLLESGSSGAANMPVVGAEAKARLKAIGLDGNAVSNVLTLVAEQRAATGVLPTDRTLVLERCRDELGDWRLILHSPYGRRVHEPWALAIAERVRKRWNIDPAVVASDDGIVARIPETTGRVPGAELFLFDPDTLRRAVADAVGSSALFAARFRECAARALLLPRETPGRRSPLWQQRLRAGQLLEIAQDYPEFPILIETVRECLQDVYDLAALDALVQRINAGALRLVEVTTDVPSPFATDLLFGYVAQFMYETDVPIAERRASVLSLDSALLGELLGQVDLAELLDASVLNQVDRELQRLEANHGVKGKEGVADLLRELGPLSTPDIAARLADDGDKAITFLAALEAERRVIRIEIGARERWASIEDAGRLRDALGVRLPGGLPAVFLQPTKDPLRDLVARFARTRGPFTTGEVASAFGLGTSVADATLRLIVEQGKLLSGRFGIERGSTFSAGVGMDVGPLAQREWVGDEVFRRLRIRSLQAARKATQPVPRDAYARLLLERQGVVANFVGSAKVNGWNLARGALEGQEGVLHVIEQLAGAPFPASAWERQILPARVRDYVPGMLDGLLSSGVVSWSGHGKLGSSDGLVALHLQEFAAETLPRAAGATSALDLSPLQHAMLGVFADGGAYFARQMAAQGQTMLAKEEEGAGQPGSPSTLSEDFQEALWDLVWEGFITNDTWTPLRALGLGSQQPSTRAMSSRRRRGFRGLQPVAQPAGSEDFHSGFTMLNVPTLAGRWSLLRSDPLPDTVRALAWAEGLLDRYAVVTRNVAMTENFPGGFPALQPVLRSMEDAGRVVRGRFVMGLGAAQFAERTTVDRLRELAEAAPALPTPVALSAIDPGNPFGTILPWPAHPSQVRPARRAGAFVVIDRGHLVLYLPQGGRQLFTYIDPEASTQTESIAAALTALSTALSRDRRARFTLELVNDMPVRRSKLASALKVSGFSSASKGLQWDGLR